jgi:Carboxypeptidase regulatory-like domain
MTDSGRIARLAAPLGAAAVLGLALVWMTRASPRAPEPIAGPEAPSASATQERASIVTPAVAPGLAEEHAAESARAVPLPPEDEGLPEADAVLIVTVHVAETGGPVRGVRLSPFPVGLAGGQSVRITQETHGTLGTAPVTGRDGRARFDLPSGVDLVLRIDGEEVALPTIEVDVPRLAKGETREAAFELAAGLSYTVRGRVVTSTGEPIAGAEVTNDPPLAYAGELGRALTDGDGRFELRADPKGSIVARREGFAEQHLPASSGSDNDGAEQTIELLRSASLYGQALDSSGMPVVGATVRIASAARGARAGRGGDAERSTAVDAGGRYVLEGLPPLATCQVELSVGPDQVARERDLIVLAEGERREMSWTVRCAPVSGLLVDQDGAPVPDHALWVVEALDDRRHYFGTNVANGLWFVPGDRPFATPKTDAEGRFLLEHLPEGRWWIGPAPTTRDASGSLAPVGEPVAVGPDGAQPRIAATRGLFVEGTVRDREDQGVPSAVVMLEPGGASGVVTCRSRGGGVFRAGPLAADVFEIRARSDDHAPQDAVEARAGDTDVVVPVTRGSPMRVRVLDESGKPLDPRKCKIEVRPYGGGAPPSAWTAQGEAFQYDNVQPGVYDLIARTADGGIGIASKVDFRPSVDAEDVTIRVGPGAQLDVVDRIAGPHTVRFLANGVSMATHPLKGPGRLHEVVPAGRTIVRAYLFHESSQPIEASVELEAGATGTVVLE